MRDSLSPPALLYCRCFPQKKKKKKKAPTQPPTVTCKMEAQSEYIHIAHTFLHVWHRFACVSRCLLTKFLRRNSVGRLLRVRCWLGTSNKEKAKGYNSHNFPSFAPPSPPTGCPEKQHCISHIKKIKINCVCVCVIPCCFQDILYCSSPCAPGMSVVCVTRIHL